MSYTRSAGCCAAFLVALFLSGCASTDPYERVTMGDTRQHVVDLLGAPSVPERDFTANERQVVQGTLATMDRQGAASFMVWKRRGELFYIVGFDKSDGVAVKRRFSYVAP